MITVKEKDFESFFNVPFKIHSNKNLFVSPFKSDLKKQLSIKNPIFFSKDDFTYFTVLKNEIPAGRITAHHHKAFNKKFNLNRCYFGFFECIHDQDTANHLFQLAEGWAVDHGFTEIAGNFNLTAMQEMGVVVSGFQNKPYTAQIYGQSYYPELLEKAGYQPEFPTSTFEIDLQSINPELILGEKEKELLNNNEYEFIPITGKLFNNSRSVILDIFNKGFANNPLFVPLTQEEFDFQSNDMMYFIDSHISFLVKYKNTPVAVSIHIPDINSFLKDVKSRAVITLPYHYFKHKLNKNRVLCIFSSVIPEFQSKGIVGAISYLSLKSMKKRGYKKFGITWIAENNPRALKKVENMNAIKLHDVKIFVKKLNFSI